MRRNGTIRIASIPDSIVNEYGEVSEGAVEWTEAYDCLITTNLDDRLGKYEDGEFRKSAYTILLEASKHFYDSLNSKDNEIVAINEEGGSVVTQVERPAFGRVSLSRYGEDLGEFRVQSFELFPSVGRIQLNVV